MRPTPEVATAADRDGACERRIRIAVARGAEMRSGSSLHRSGSAARSQSSFFALGLPWFDCHLRFFVLPCIDFATGLLFFMFSVSLGSKNNCYRVVNIQ